MRFSFRYPAMVGKFAPEVAQRMIGQTSPIRFGDAPLGEGTIVAATVAEDGLEIHITVESFAPALTEFLEYRGNWSMGYEGPRSDAG